MLSWFGPSCSVDIVFEDSKRRKTVEVSKDNSEKDSLLLYHANETVAGQIELKLKSGTKSILHNGIKVELIGQIELYYDRSNTYDFTTLLLDLAQPGELTSDITYPFKFPNAEMAYESYVGQNVRLRYLIRFTINVRKSISNITKEQEFWVNVFQPEPEINNSIKMEVGIEDCLHIEFEYNKSKYHLKDVVIGKVYFLLVRIKVKHMEICLLKRESTGTGNNIYNESETITKFETMDGAPVRGESIPIRLFLSGFDLTPSYKNIHNKFSVRYYLNLVLVDEEDRRYFKQQEITLWRKAPAKKKDKSKKDADAAENFQQVPVEKSDS
eukprot:TRINITY_DN1661_c0_g1_i1.p1 TRINITY_DN1661_c0_g1~~TRINITY_DN1661_c0_g1_i1.p1  ORF type:complete len:326 (-),score=75.08 TRINITY_DN1661_c0_g1_i1:144-1121(-)